MKDLVKRIGLSNEEEIAIIGQLDRWNQNGILIMLCFTFNVKC